MPTTQEYFLAALNHIFDSGALKQRDIAAKSGFASQTINAIVRGRKVAGLQKQEEIAVACGYEYVDFLLLARRTLGGYAGHNRGRDVTRIGSHRRDSPGRPDGGRRRKIEFLAYGHQHGGEAR